LRLREGGHANRREHGEQTDPYHERTLSRKIIDPGILKVSASGPERNLSLRSSVTIHQSTDKSRSC
jgi:hypothetical protein